MKWDEKSSEWYSSDFLWCLSDKVHKDYSSERRCQAIFWQTTSLSVIWINNYPIIAENI